MQTYHLKLQSDVSKTFRANRAANSLDIDVDKKSIHEISIQADITSPFKIGLILGASGSGKTTLAKKIYGEECFKVWLDQEKAIIDQLPSELSYDECASILSGVGLTSVPCWIRPIKTLSNGQKARAEAALAMFSNEDIVIIDEWTSVVDRTVAKVMSHCLQKFARTKNKKIVLLSCHYDVVEWLNPDWVIDCNQQKFLDRRLLHPEERKRTEQLQFELKETSSSSWKYFSKYHYLSESLPGGKIYTFGLFHEENQIGFVCFANYVPTRKNSVPIFHSNRVVIHPDFCGFGLGLKMVNEAAKILKTKFGYRIMAKFSSIPMATARMKDKKWKLLDVKRQIGKMNVGGNIKRKTGYRENVKTFSFEYVG